MKINGFGLDIIKRHEGLRLSPYLCPASVPTIGYGTIRYPDGTPVALTDPDITDERASALLDHEVRGTEYAISVMTSVPITENQFSALVSFAYNVGVGATRCSTLMRKLNRGDTIGAGKEFPRWKFGGGKVLPGLVRRRNEEQALFFRA